MATEASTAAETKRLTWSCPQGELAALHFADGTVELTVSLRISRTIAGQLVQTLSDTVFSADEAA